MKKIQFLLLAIALSALAGCGGSNDAGTKPPGSGQGKGPLVVAITKDENTLTPYTYLTGTPGIDVLRLIYDSLFTFDPDNIAVPWMVENDYTVDSSNRIYKMRLKDGLFWHDGEPLTAEDVKFTFEYPLTQNRARWKNISNQIAGIEISDGNVITITLTEGNPNFLEAGLCDMPIIPKHIYGGIEDAEAYDGSTVGSSLYRLSEYRIGEYYKLEAVEGYFKGEAKVAKINMPIMTDFAAVSQGLISNQISAATQSIGPETLDVFKDTKGIKILSGRGYSPSMLQFNCERRLLSDPQFRQALIYAIDIQTMIDTVMLGYATPALPGFYTDDMPGALTDRTYIYDKEMANTILDGLGYTEKGSDGIRLANGEPILFELLAHSGNTTRIRTAELVKEYLERVGIGVTVTVMEPDTIDGYVWPDFDVAKGRDYDMAMWGWSAPVQLDPAVLVRIGMSGHALGNLNISGLASVEYDALCQAYLDRPGAKERSEIARDMQALLAELAPFVNLWYDTMNYAVNTGNYDGWVVQQGTGIINRYSFLP